MRFSENRGSLFVLLVPCRILVSVSQHLGSSRHKFVDYLLGAIVGMKSNVYYVFEQEVAFIQGSLRQHQHPQCGHPHEQRNGDPHAWRSEVQGDV